MKHMQILKRAWTILWSYRALWIFGILIAMTSTSFSGNSSSNSGGSSRGGTPSGTYTIPNNLPPEISRFFQQINDFFTHGITPQITGIFIAVVVGLVCLFVLIAILMRAINYVSQVALMRMVDHFESTGEKLNWRKGLRLGWSRSAWRLFLIDLLIGLPFFLVFLVLFGCAAIPVLLGLLGGTGPTHLGVIGTIGLVFLILFLVIIVSVVLGLFMEIIRRVCAIQGQGVLDSIRQGWQMVRQSLKDVFLMWLILVGIRIGYSLVLIPVFIALLLLALLIGGGVGVVVYFAVHALASLTAGIISAVGVGLLILIALISIPMLFLSALGETYVSTAWTLAYRDINPTLPIAFDPVPAPDLPAEGSPESAPAG